MKKRLSDPKFIIPVKADAVAHSDAPPELIREHMLDAYPNWHDCLQDLLQALDDANVPKSAAPDAGVLRSVIDAREEGRRLVLDAPEEALTNWFSITRPARIYYYKFEGLQQQLATWARRSPFPIVRNGRLVASFADPIAFNASAPPKRTVVVYDVAFADFFEGIDFGPYADRSSLSNDVANLLRQHFDQKAIERGLRPVSFGNGETGWFFPDGIVPGNQISFLAPGGRRIRRTVSGKFKKLRWHLCLFARPHTRSALVCRVHANVVLSDGGEVLPGEKTHVRRRVWRDRLLAAIHYIADGSSSIEMEAGNVSFGLITWPLSVQLPVSYEASDPPPPREEDDEGNILPTVILGDHREFGLEDDPDENDRGDGQ
jgi:hypothetical protein